MSEHCRPSSISGQSDDSLTHRQPIAPFFLSPTWNWPEFDPACCQECGRVIPMHETGWLLNDAILCGECHEILEQQQEQRQKQGQRQGQEQEQEQRQGQEQRLTKPKQEAPLGPRPQSPGPSEQRLTKPKLEEAPPAAIPVDLPGTSAEPTFELREPDRTAWRIHFADGLLHDHHKTAPAPAAATDSLPLIDAMIPRFELREPDRSAWRVHFADGLLRDIHETAPAAATATDALPLIDAMIPRFELREPDRTAWRVHFADGLLRDIHETAPAAATATDALPLIDAMLASLDTSVADHSASDDEVSDALQHNEREKTVPAPIPAPAPASATAPAPAPAPAPARARKRQPRPTAPSPIPRPLSFQHPVDVLLNELHERKIDAQFRQMIRQSRQRDPFFAEVDAMLAAATVLRDHWMARREAQDRNKSSAG